MKAKFIFEKFVEESDPIKDMGIGNINFKEEYHEQFFKPAGKLYKKWEKYINQFKGKIICGKFHVYEHKGDYEGIKKYAEVKFIKIVMSQDGVLNLESSFNTTYCILDGESYEIKEDKGF